MLVQQHPLLGQGQVSLQGSRSHVIPPLDEVDRCKGGSDRRLLGRGARRRAVGVQARLGGGRSPGQVGTQGNGGQVRPRGTIDQDARLSVS